MRTSTGGTNVADRKRRLVFFWSYSVAWVIVLLRITYREIESKMYGVPTQKRGRCNKEFSDLRGAAGKDCSAFQVDVASFSPLHVDLLSLKVSVEATK
jgi:hypothetical protein